MAHCSSRAHARLAVERVIRPTACRKPAQGKRGTSAALGLETKNAQCPNGASQRRVAVPRWGVGLICRAESQGGVRVRRGLALGWLASGLWPVNPHAAVQARGSTHGGSIPHIPLVNLQPMLAAQRAEFILKRHLSVVLLLRRDVFADVPDVGLAHGERAVSALPEKNPRRPGPDPSSIWKGCVSPFPPDRRW